MNRLGTKHPFGLALWAPLAGLVFGVGLLVVPPPLGAAPPGPARPNVLIIHVDQLRFDCLARAATAT